MFITGVVAIAYASEIPCMMKELEYDSDHTGDKEEETHKESIEGSNEEQENNESKQWLQATKKDKEKGTSAISDRKNRRIFLKPRKPETEKVNLSKQVVALYLAVTAVCFQYYKYFQATKSLIIFFQSSSLYDLGIVYVS